MKPRRRPSRPVPIPDAVAANATWTAYCAALRARMVARTAGQHALADAECARIREWLSAHDVDPAGLWGAGRWVLSGNDVVSRAAWDHEEQKMAEEYAAEQERHR